MESFEKVYEVVKNRLSEKRFYHSVCVMERAVEYAKIYNVDVEKAKLAGIAHDIAKEIPKDQRIKLAKEYNVEVDEIEKISTGLLHGKLGAAICRKEFEFSDDICSAVEFHTTGKENMSMLEKIIYIADATGKDRDYPEAEEGYKLAIKDIDKALIFFFKKTLEWTIEDEKLIHLNTIKAYNYFFK